jgi:hypothetical protein
MTTKAIRAVPHLVLKFDGSLPNRTGFARRPAQTQLPQVVAPLLERLG